jgi:multidrug efflux pump subunit AcrB
LAALDGLDAAYGRALGWVLRRKVFTICSILVFFGLSLGLVRHIGSEFFPESDESQFTVNFRTPIGNRVERTEQTAIKIENVMRATVGEFNAGLTRKGVAKAVISSAGLPKGRASWGASGPHSGSVSMNLVSPYQRTESDVVIAEKVRAGLKDALPGTNVYFFIGGMVKRIQNFGSTAPIDVEVLGYDLGDAARFAQEISNKLQSLSDPQGRPLLTDIQLSREQNSPELDVKVDRQKAGLLGVTEQDVSQTVLASLVGNTQFLPIPYTDPKTGNQYSINVRLDNQYRDQVSDLHSLFVRTPKNSLVTLDSVAEIHRSSGPVMIERKYLQRIVHVTANVAPTSDLGAATRAVSGAVAEVTPPDGFSAHLGGQSVEQAKAFSGLVLAALMALALVYMVLASEFKSLLDPLIIMFSVPLGVSGVFIMLYLTGTKLSVNSFMGIIMMIGIVVSNGVLLVAYANQLREQGRTLEQATIEAGRTRLRPILMTTIATVFGLLPMALGLAEGSETNLPLARAVVGGLTVSTFFTLFLIPTLYTVLDRFAKRQVDPDEVGVIEAAAGART